MKPTKEQVVNRAIEIHLQYSNSLDSLPSKNALEVRGWYVDACMNEDFTPDEWHALSDEERSEYTARRTSEVGAAVESADMKWQAIRLLLAA